MPAWLLLLLACRAHEMASRKIRGPGSRLWAQRQKSLVVPAKAVGGLVRAQLVVVVVAVPADGLIGLSKS